MEKTFTVAGTSNLNGVIAYRFANDLKGRIKVLERNGHTDVNLMLLPNEMTKEQAIDWLNQQEIFAQANRVTSSTSSAASTSTASVPRRTRKSSKDPRAGVMNEDGFIEPEDESIQVKMTHMARQYPGLSRYEIYQTVMLQHEPNY